VRQTLGMLVTAMAEAKPVQKTVKCELGGTKFEGVLMHGADDPLESPAEVAGSPMWMPTLRARPSTTRRWRSEPTRP
jgi:hypothetical protein